MSLLLSLPTEVANAILSEWLVIVSWGLLDCAVSKSRLRQFLHEQFALSDAPDFSIQNNRKQIYAWIFSRGIKLRSLNLYSDDVGVNGLQFPVNYDYINVVVVHSGLQACSAILNNCHKLKSLELFGSRTIKGLDVRICSSLTSIVLSNWTPECVLFIHQNCPNLKALSLNLNYADDTVYSLVKANPQLEHIKIGCDEQFFKYLCCAPYPSLRSINLQVPSFLFSDLNKLIAGHPMDLIRINICLEYRARDNYLRLCEIDPDPDLLVFLDSQSCLRSILFDGLHNQTDDMLRVLLKHSANSIVKLIIGVCELLSVPCLVDVLRHCTQLSHLVLFHLNMTNEMALQIFNEDVPNSLSSLTLQVGNNMNVATMSSVIRNCPYLQFCHFIEVPYDNFSEDEKAELSILRSWQSKLSDTPLKLTISWISAESNDDDDDSIFNETLNSSGHFGGASNEDDEGDDYSSSDENAEYVYTAGNGLVHTVGILELVHHGDGEDEDVQWFGCESNSSDDSDNDSDSNNIDNEQWGGGEEQEESGDSSENNSSNAESEDESLDQHGGEDIHEEPSEDELSDRDDDFEVEEEEELEDEETGDSDHHEDHEDEDDDCDDQSYDDYDNDDCDDDGYDDYDDDCGYDSDQW